MNTLVYTITTFFFLIILCVWKSTCIPVSIKVKPWWLLYANFLYNSHLYKDLHLYDVHTYTHTCTHTHMHTHIHNASWVFYHFSMRKYYNEARKMRYFESLVDIPILEPVPLIIVLWHCCVYYLLYIKEPPQFLLPGQVITVDPPTSPAENFAEVPASVTTSVPVSAHPLMCNNLNGLVL